MVGSAWLTRDRIAEMVRFCLVGLATFGLDSGCLVALHAFTRMPLWLDVAIPYSLASLFNFIACRQWVYEQARKGANPTMALVRYAVVVVVGLLITTAAIPGLTAAGLDYRIAKTLMSTLVGAANYVILPWWVFRGAPAEPAAAEPSAAEPVAEAEVTTIRASAR